MIIKLKTLREIFKNLPETLREKLTEIGPPEEPNPGIESLEEAIQAIAASLEGKRLFTDEFKSKFGLNSGQTFAILHGMKEQKWRVGVTEF